MKRFVLSPRSCVIATGLLMCSTSSLSAGTVTVTFTEDGGGAGVISVSFSGSLDFVSGGNTTPVYSRYINPNGGTVGFADGADLTKAWVTGGGTPTMIVTSTSSTPAAGAVFAGFGTGGYQEYVLSNVTGDKFATFLNGIQLGRSIASGQSISGSATLSGTFATLGISAGTSTTTFTLDGQANTVIYQTAAASAVPGSAGPAALIGLAGVSRRRRRG